MVAGSILLLAVILITHAIVYTQPPDWNEELQAARDLPQGSLEERLQRDKAVLQVNLEAVIWLDVIGCISSSFFLFFFFFNSLSYTFHSYLFS